MDRIPKIHQGRYGRVFVINLDAPLVEHAHSDSHLIFAIQDDVNDIISVSSVDYRLTRSQAIAVNKYEPHAHKKPNGGVSRCLIFYLNQDWLRDRNLFKKECQAFRIPNFPVSDSFGYFLDQFSTYLVADPRAIDIEAYVFQTVRSCLQAMESEEENLSGLLSRNCETDYRIEKSVEYMQKHLGRRFKMDDVAKASGLSRPHLFSLFRKHLNLTPSVYWNTLRIETAIDQLLNDEVALMDLANTLGFSEPGNFSRFFRNHTGCSPSKYRIAAEYSEC